MNNIPNDLCRCVTQTCKIKEKCARWVDPKNPEKHLEGRPVPHADFSSQGLPCPHFLSKESR